MLRRAQRCFSTAVGVTSPNLPFHFFVFYQTCLLIFIFIFFFRSGEFYGQGMSVANLELVARFFEKYPNYKDLVFLSVKGGLLPGQLSVDGSRENLRRSVDNILKVLRGTKKLDLFESARRDPKYEIEHYAEVLNEMVKEGKFDYIGLSEVGAETVRRAQKVSRGSSLLWVW
jgi:pyridoxine 4-dehydrogenase